MTQAPTHSIIFNGELQTGVQRHQVIAEVAKLTNLDAEEILDRLFSVKPVLLNQVSGAELAAKYMEAFQATGLRLELQPAQSEHDEIPNAEIEFAHFAPIERQEMALNYQIEEQLQPELNSTEPQEPIDGPVWALVFEGALKPNTNKAEAISNLAHLTKSDEDEVREQVFSVVPVVLLAGADRTNLASAQSDFEACGLQLVIMQQDNDDTLPASKLKIRNDRPPIAPEKPVPAFAVGLVLLLLLFTGLWGLNNIYSAGYFDKEPPLELAIRLESKMPAEQVEAPVTLKEETTRPEEKTPVLEENVPEVQASAQAPRKSEPAEPEVKPTPPARQQATPEQAQPPQSPSEAVPVPKQPQATGPTQAQLDEIKNQYFLTLLNWFARPEHHSYDQKARQRNLAGEVKVAIIINRQGQLLEVDILESSSDELAAATEASAKVAAPYPNIPAEIEGNQYRFVLPLKYELENQ